MLNSNNCLAQYSVIVTKCALLTHWELDKMVDIFAEGMLKFLEEIGEFRFNENLFPDIQLTVLHHWFW